MLIAIVSSVIYYYRSQSIVFNPQQTEDGDIKLGTTLEDVCAQKLGIKDLHSIPEGRMWFLSPNCDFGFQYISNGNDYGIESFSNNPNIFAVCETLGCHSVGIEVTSLAEENNKPVYDYKRLAYDRVIPDSFEMTEWNGYLAYRAVFSHKQYPERHLFIHIPHSGQLFTLYRSTTDNQIDFDQFSVISETLTLAEK